MAKDYKTVLSNAKDEFVEKRSRFIGYCKPVTCEQEAVDFINEKRFCKAFVRDKFHLNKWGKIKISMALREKGLSNDLITAALKVIDEGEYEELLASLLKSKQNTIKYEFEYEKQGKLYQFAQSRGFENQVIERVLRLI